MKRAFLVVMLCLAATALPACSTAPIRIGAIYPLSGSQGPGGVDEFHGVQLAASLVNDDGGAAGRPISLDSLDVGGADAVPGAIARLHHDGVSLVMGSYGSTIAGPAAAAATRSGMLYWETGAVGDFTAPPATGLAFRFPPNGVALGTRAITFARAELAGRADPTQPTRLVVAHVDDVYGRTVARGAEGQAAAAGWPLAADVAYDPHRFDPTATAAQIAAARPDVLFVVAYLEDGIALRRADVAAHLPVQLEIGSSSSYCMLPFGRTLGADAVGLYASDKPDGDALRPDSLTAEGRTLLSRAGRAYRARYRTSMTAAALAGFSAAWALFHHVLPAARALTPAGVAAAAHRTELPDASLPNGSGMLFGATGDNERAASVIWEWTAPGRIQVVWPPQFTSRGAAPEAGW